MIILPPGLSAQTFGSGQAKPAPAEVAPELEAPSEQIITSTLEAAIVVEAVSKAITIILRTKSKAVTTTAGALQNERRTIRQPFRSLPLNS